MKRAEWPQGSGIIQAPPAALGPGSTHVVQVQHGDSSITQRDQHAASMSCCELPQEHSKQCSREVLLDLALRPDGGSIEHFSPSAML